MCRIVGRGKLVSSLLRQGKWPSHHRLSGRVEIMRYFETADIVKKTEIGKSPEVLSDYFSKEQWNTKWVSVWVKQGR